MNKELTIWNQVLVGIFNHQNKSLMEICKHVIKDEEIIGIGPLMSAVTNDPVQLAVYKEGRLWFDLHLKGNTVKIESPWFSFAEHLSEKEREETNKEFVEWRQMYFNAKDTIDTLILK